MNENNVSDSRLPWRLGYFLGLVRKLGLYAVGIAGSGAVIALCGYGPPVAFPGVPILTVFISLVTLMLVYHFGVRRQALAINLDRWIKFAAVGAVVTPIIYAVLFEPLTKRNDTGVYARGFLIRPALQERLATNLPHTPPGEFDATALLNEHTSTDDLLEAAGNKATDVYVPLTVYAVQALFVVLWCTTAMCVAAVIGIFVVPFTKGARAPNHAAQSTPAPPAGQIS